MLSLITSFFAADWRLVGYELLKPEHVDNTPEKPWPIEYFYTDD